MLRICKAKSRLNCLERIKRTNKVWREKNHDRIIAKTKTPEFKERDRLRKRAYRKADPEKYRERSRLWYAQNRELAKAKVNAYRLRNRELVRDQRAQRKAVRMDLETSLLALWFNNAPVVNQPLAESTAPTSA